MISVLMRWLYSLLFTCLLPWVFFRLWVRGIRLPAYRKRWAERLGHAPLPPLEEVLWVHAVSVGEALAAVPLIHRIRKMYPNTPILVTTTTPTGSERVQAAFKDMLGKQIYHCYLPYDLPWTLRFFFARVKPKLLILMETELWPNLLHACYARRLPVLIANARLSPLSVKRYAWLGKHMHAMLRAVKAVAAQSSIDAKRFHQLGMPEKAIFDVGNIKFDLHLPGYLQEAGAKLRDELGGASRLVWIAASTHEGEETLLLEAYRTLKPRFPDLLLFIVPRHPDRFNKVASLCEESFNVARRSQKVSCSSETDIFLGDTMGELPLFYAASDVAFVGGSFVPVGGHNLLEPAALGLPVVTGPVLFNFVAISELLINAKGASVVEDKAALIAKLESLFESRELRQEQGHKAKLVVEQNRGALEKLLQLIDGVWQAAPRVT